MAHDNFFGDGFNEIIIGGGSSNAQGIYDLDIIIKNLQLCDQLTPKRKERIANLLDAYLRNIEHDIKAPGSQYYLDKFMIDKDVRLEEDEDNNG